MSSTVLVTARDQQVGRCGDLDDRLRSMLGHTREMIICFKKLSVISDSNGSDSLAIVPSTLMQVMTLERFVSVHSPQKYFSFSLLLFIYSVSKKQTIGHCESKRRHYILAHKFAKY